MEKEIMTHLRVHKGAVHNHDAQNPVQWNDV